MDVPRGQLDRTGHVRKVRRHQTTPTVDIHTRAYSDVHFGDFTLIITTANVHIWSHSVSAVSQSVDAMHGKGNVARAERYIR